MEKKQEKTEKQKKQKKQKNKMAKKQKGLLALAVILAALLLAFGLYFGNYYHADKTAQQAMKSSRTVKVKQMAACLMALQRKMPLFFTRERKWKLPPTRPS